MSDQNLKLASEFPAVSYETWRGLAEEALKGASFDKKLVTLTADGIKINPLYNLDDLDETTTTIHDAMVASAARRSAKVAEKAGWDIRQWHAHPDPVTTNAAILEDLENGATSIHLVLDGAARTGAGASAADAGESGVMLYSLADVALTLKGVLPSLAPISIDAGQAAVAAGALVAAHCEQDANAALIEFNYDPIGTLAATGSLPVSADAALQQAAEFARDIATLYPKASALNVNSSHWFNAGATDATELAIALATGTAYLRALTAAGLDIQSAARTLTFTAAVSTDFFTGIAKLRALRLAWTRVLEACDANAAPVTINAVSAEHVLSKVDPWVNMLRTTVTSFAAGVGGADSVISLPYDHLLGLADNFSRRIARNTQLILEEESNVHRVLDPAGGSWYVENLTRELAQAAWTKFQAIEASGGIVAKVLDGSLAAEIAEMWQAKEKRLATRRDPLTGVSEFPNIDEAAVTPAVPDLARLREQARQRQTQASGEIGSAFKALVAAAKAGANIQQLFAAAHGNGQGAVSIAPLPQHRLAENFEALRDRAAAHQAATGQLPQVFLANVGRVAEHTGRATFARNFFEAGGIKAISNNGFSAADELVAAFKASGAKIAVICGSDNQYDEHALAFAQGLKAAGVARLYLAGSPGEKADAYRNAGVDDFVFMGGNVLDVCAAALDTLGVK